jgi:hypothetical protein
VSAPCPAIIERTYYGRLPKAPPTPKQREAWWRWKWAHLTVEQTLDPANPDITSDDEPEHPCA